MLYGAGWRAWPWIADFRGRDASYGAVPLLDAPLTLLLPLATIAAALKRAGKY